MIKVKGDLLALAEQGQFDIIVQGCNCFNTMGSGLAKQIKAQYPEAYEVDNSTTKGDYRKLGNYTNIHTGKFHIINAYTQFKYNRASQHEDRFEYMSFALILQKLAYYWPNARYGFPMIGMGLAGGDPDLIMLDLSLFDNNITESGGSVTLVEFAT